MLHGEKKNSGARYAKLLNVMGYAVNAFRHGVGRDTALDGESMRKSKKLLPSFTLKKSPSGKALQHSIFHSIPWFGVL